MRAEPSAMRIVPSTSWSLTPRYLQPMLEPSTSWARMISSPGGFEAVSPAIWAAALKASGPVSR